jgi:membrane dipeptidase
VTTRRAFLRGLGAGVALACGAGPPAARAADAPPYDGLAVDLHSHAGHVNRSSAAFSPVADPMRAGGQSALCLAIVADSPVTRRMPEGGIKQIRQPSPGELAAWGEASFGRVHDLIARQGLATITTVAALDACRGAGATPGAIVTSEGADFLDGQIGRVEDAYRRRHLRQLQLVHFRINELGDIQTESPVHDGLTGFGADVIRACNRLGIVVDLAHGSFDLVKRAVAVATRPLVLSHTSLSASPRPRSRLVSAEHARLVAETGGVVGVWPAGFAVRDRAGYAAGIARMVEAIGADHVGIGTDMEGLNGDTVFGDYAELPAIVAALRATGLDTSDVAKILGGNYRRVFAAVTAAA